MSKFLAGNRNCTHCGKACKKLRHGWEGSRGLCAACRGRLQRRGTVERKNRVKGAGTIDPDGYRRIYVEGKQTMEHRHVWERANGPIPEYHIVHHRDGNKLNNSLDNLEILTRAEHMAIHPRPRDYRNRFCKVMR